jgi:hypothetical protein
MIRRVEIASGTCSATNAFKPLGRLLTQLDTSIYRICEEVQAG